MCGQEWTLLPSEGRKIVSGGYADSAWTIVAGPNKTAGSYLESATIPNVMASCQISEVFFVDRTKPCVTRLIHSDLMFSYQVSDWIVWLWGRKLNIVSFVTNGGCVPIQNRPPLPPMCPWHTL